MSATDLRVAGHVPPAEAWVARRLWAAGVYDRALLEHAQRWGADVERAWRECERLALLVPLALLRGCSLDRIAWLGRRWWRSAARALAGEHPQPQQVLEWSPDDWTLALRCVDLAIDPDPELDELNRLRQQALTRAGQRAPGRHRYALLVAASHVAGLGVARVTRLHLAAVDGELLAELLLDALRSAAAQADLFAVRPDVEAWRAAALEHARELLEVETEVP